MDGYKIHCLLLVDIIAWILNRLVCIQVESIKKKEENWFVEKRIILFRFRFDDVRSGSIQSKKTGVTLFHFMRICGPAYYYCSYFSDHAYCHHILAIN